MGVGEPEDLLRRYITHHQQTVSGGQDRAQQMGGLGGQTSEATGQVVQTKRLAGMQPGEGGNKAAARGISGSGLKWPPVK